MMIPVMAPLASLREQRIVFLQVDLVLEMSHRAGEQKIETKDKKKLYLFLLRARIELAAFGWLWIIQIIN